jgi:hypothetical protein
MPSKAARLIQIGTWLPVLGPGLAELGAVGPDVYVNLISEFTMASHADGYPMSLHACMLREAVTGPRAPLLHTEPGGENANMDG